MYPTILVAMVNSESLPGFSPGAFVGLQAEVPELVLASASRARLALLRDAGLSVTVTPAFIDEGTIKRAARGSGATPDEAALLLAEHKGRVVAKAGTLVIAADQLLVCEGQWFDKPPDMLSARTQLLSLRGRTHVLHTAVTLHDGDRVAWRHVSRPNLTVRDFSDAMLDAYLEREGGRVLCSVGAYRLEGPGIQLFDRIDGEYAAILGMPLVALLDVLRQRGVLQR